MLWNLGTSTLLALLSCFLSVRREFVNPVLPPLRTVVSSRDRKTTKTQKSPAGCRNRIVIMGTQTAPGRGHSGRGHVISFHHTITCKPLTWQTGHPTPSHPRHNAPCPPPSSMSGPLLIMKASHPPPFRLECSPAHPCGCPFL